MDAASQAHKVTFLALSNSLDVQPLLSEALAHQTSNRRYLVERMRSNYSVTVVGLDGRRNP